MSASKFLIPIVVPLLVVGCATQPQSVWFKNGASQQEFEIDKGQCNAQAFAVAGGNMYQIAIVQNQCLKGKGWQLVNPNQIANANNQLFEEREKNKQANEERCANIEFSSIYAKTPCLATQIEFRHMTNEEKITNEQKVVFVKWREAIDISNQQIVDTELRYNGSIGKKYGNYYLATMKPENDKNNLDLYNGKITWGQYNSRRKEIYSKLIDFMK